MEYILLLLVITLVTYLLYPIFLSIGKEYSLRWFKRSIKDNATINQYDYVKDEEKAKKEFKAILLKNIEDKNHSQMSKIVLKMIRGYGANPTKVLRRLLK